MTVKLLAQATTELLIDQPARSEVILEALQRLIQVRYPKIKWPVLIEAIIERMATHNRIDRIKITSAEPLTTVQIETIVEQLGVSNPDIATNIDSSLLAGFIIKKSDQILDLSAKGRLDALAQAVTKE
jgi:F0F1-type ATP synthase delta subunit